MPSSLRVRHALVTGGAKRVGAAIVRELVAIGFRVTFTYNASGESARSLAESLAGRASPQRCDLADPVDVAGLIDRLAVERLDLLVNNASVYLPDAAMTSVQRDAMRHVNVDAPVSLVDQATPLLKRSAGCVVNLLDILAERPMPSFSAYCATKASLWNATLSMARLLAPEARAVGIAPGVVDWPDDLPQADRDAYLKRVPLGRAGTPHDVASLVRFLALEGTYITGQIIRLDGGRSIV